MLCKCNNTRNEAWETEKSSKQTLEWRHTRDIVKASLATWLIRFGTVGRVMNDNQDSSLDPVHEAPTYLLANFPR